MDIIEFNKYIEINPCSAEFIFRKHVNMFVFSIISQ